MHIEFILDFLKNLADNNNREWMERHRKDYQDAKQIFHNVVEQLITEIASFDSSLNNVEPKSCIFRLHRDIRFSKDKRPYKENFGAFLSRDGKHSTHGGYYLHLQPENQSMLAGGIYMPPPELLKKIRQEIDYNYDAFQKILDNKDFKELFVELQGEKLKKAPKDYPPDHPHIELLKHKSYVVFHGFKDQMAGNPDFIRYCTEIFRAMKPLNDFLNVAVS